MEQKRKLGAVLVTGGAGYIGSVVTKLFVAQGRRVVVLDALVHGRPTERVRGVTFIRGDVGDRTLVRRLLARHQINGIIHCAGLISVTDSTKRPKHYERHNVHKTRTLLRTAFRAGVRNIVFLSSAAVYGKPREIPITENSPLKPISPYGKNKLAIERELFARAQQGLRYATLRCFNVAGAHENVVEYHVPEQHLIPIVVRSVRAETPIALFGLDHPTPDGTALRDYVHVYDVAQACVAFYARLERGAHRGAPRTLTDYAYNVGLGRGYSVERVIQTIEKRMSKKALRHPRPKRGGEPPVLIASVRKLRRTGWRPKYRTLGAIVASLFRSIRATRRSARGTSA